MGSCPSTNWLADFFHSKLVFGKLFWFLHFIHGVYPMSFYPPPQDHQKIFNGWDFSQPSPNGMCKLGLPKYGTNRLIFLVVNSINFHGLNIQREFPIFGWGTLLSKRKFHRKSKKTTVGNSCWMVSHQNMEKKNHKNLQRSTVHHRLRPVQTLEHGLDPRRSGSQGLDPPL